MCNFLFIVMSNDNLALKSMINLNKAKMINIPLT